MAAVDKVVVVVFDGLRPDLVPGRMPALGGFMDEGLVFTSARSVFPSLTRVATTSLATGAWPGQHGIVNNAFHMPGLGLDGVLDTSRPEHLYRLAQRTGSVVAVRSLGEQLAAQGRSMAAIHCGSAGSAMLVNHEVKRNGHWTFSVHGGRYTQTPEAVDKATALCGPLPSMDIPKFEPVAYAGRVAQAMALGEAQPDVTVIWFPEPDTSFHYRGIGTAAADAVMRHTDQVFAELLDSIRSGPHGDRTAIVALSDHGQITTTYEFDILRALTREGFKAGANPDPGVALTVTLGNMGEIRATSPDTGRLAEVAQWLMERDEIGMVFAEDSLAATLPGTFPRSLVHQSHARSAELLYIARSSDGMGPNGLPGHGIYTGGDVPLGGGMHGGLNRYEMETVLAFDIPGGRRSETDSAPAALIDLSPTILSLLGAGMLGAGRLLPLFEPSSEPVHRERLEARNGLFSQWLIRDHIGDRIYLAEGGRSAPQP